MHSEIADVKYSWRRLPCFYDTALFFFIIYVSLDVVSCSCDICLMKGADKLSAGLLTASLSNINANRSRLDHAVYTFDCVFSLSLSL